MHVCLIFLHGTKVICTHHIFSLSQMQDLVRRQAYYGSCLTECSNFSAPLQGSLNVHVKRAQGLPDTDVGLFQGKSDPFVSVTAYNYASSATKSTREIIGSHAPVWEETLSFGVDVWKSITVGVLDSDCGPDEVLIPFRSFPICSADRCSISYVAGSSQLSFDIEVIPNY